jgi:hypothetical protein
MHFGCWRMPFAVQGDSIAHGLDIENVAVDCLYGILRLQVSVTVCAHSNALERKSRMSDSIAAHRACAANGTTAPGMAPWGRPAFLAALGWLALAVGTLVYLTDRGASRAVLIPAFGAFAGSSVFGAIGQWLPSFVHPFSFALFTAAALPPRSSPAYGACVAWCAVNIAFEVGQHPHVSAHLAEAIRGGFGQTPLTRFVANFFLRGTFDVGDVFAAMLGALAAAVVLRLMHCGLETSHAQQGL